MLAAPTATAPTCYRCGSRLAYEGRPCHICISPAVFDLKAGEVVEIRDSQRAVQVKLPKFAQSVVVRGKDIRKPRSERVVAVARTIGRWTWNSLGIAACIHLLAVAIAMFFGQQIEEIADYVQRVEVREEIASVPVVAPEPDEIQIPEFIQSDDELVMPDQIIEDPDIVAGDPEYEAPPEQVYAPLPQVAPPHPAPPARFKFRRPDAGPGLGGGETSSSTRPAAGSGLFRNRNGQGKAAAIQEHGGGADTEDAVNLGLAYLAKRQETDGSWNPNDGFDKRPRWATSDNGYRGAITALCTLPFLAAGNSTESGTYKRNVKRAIEWLMDQQTSDGCVAYKNLSQMYTHTVATLVLCEAYGMTEDEEIGLAAERAVRFLERSQGVGGGWDYKGYVTSSGNDGFERNDLSISGWGALAFKSAKAVGIKVNASSWKSLAGLYDRYSLENGETYYADRNSGGLAGTRKGIGMVGVGMAARVILDPELFEKRNYSAERELLKNLPDWERFSDPSPDSSNPNFTTFYGWYYGTLGLFLLNDGRGPAWDTWNKALKTQLLEHQELKGSRKGSWEAADSWIGPIMGDLYSTALSVLCLEVYYRYNTVHRPDSESEVVKPREDRPLPRDVPRVREEPEPEHPKNGIVINGEELDLDKAGHRSKYLRLLSRDKGLGALPVLLEHLEDESTSVRSTALMELSRLKAKDAVGKVKAMLDDPDDQPIRLTVIDTLGSLGDRAAHPSLIRLLSSSEESVQNAAQSALRKLADGKDFGINKRAWEDWFSRNP